MQPQGIIVVLNPWEMMHTVSKMHRWLEWHPSSKFNNKSRHLVLVVKLQQVSNKKGGL
jgi:hypothetical protein